MIGFNASINKTNKNLSIPTDFKHILILGETGSGKTASVITPLIFDRMKKNHGIIVFDFKGNYHYTVKALAKKLNKLQNIIELGKDYGKYTNLLQDLPIETIDKILRDALAHDKYDKFWEESAIQLGISILGIVKYMNKLVKNYQYSYNFSTLIDIASSAKNLKKFKNNTISTLNKILNSSEDFSKELYLIELISKYYKMLDEIADEDSLKRMIYNNEKTVLASVIASLVNPIANLIKNNININEIDILKELSKRKIIIVSFNDFNENTLNVIVRSIFAKIHLFKMNYPEFPITIVIDEAQKILNDNFELPLDTLREYQVEVVLATQSVANLKEKLSNEKVDSLLANLVHKIYLNGQDMKLSKYEAYYNEEYYKLTPVEIDNITKFSSEKEYQKLYSKLNNLPFMYKNQEVVYSSFNETELIVKNSNLKAIGKVDFIPKRFSKKELCKLFEFLTLEEIKEKTDENYLDFDFIIEDKI